MVPGMLAALTDFNFVNGCVGMEVDGSNVTATREIDGGSEAVATSLPLVVWRSERNCRRIRLTYS